MNTSRSGSARAKSPTTPPTSRMRSDAAQRRIGSRPKLTVTYTTDRTRRLNTARVGTSVQSLSTTALSVGGASRNTPSSTAPTRSGSARSRRPRRWLSPAHPAPNAAHEPVTTSTLTHQAHCALTTLISITTKMVRNGIALVRMSRRALYPSMKCGVPRLRNQASVAVMVSAVMRKVAATGPCPAGPG